MSTSRSPRRRATARLLVVPALLLAACSEGDAGLTGEAVIEEELAEQLGLGELDATCDQPDELEQGQVFTCTATTEDGRIVDFEAEFDSDTEIFVYSTNVLVPSDLELVEAEAAQLLGPEVGATIDPGDVDCGDEAVIVEDTGVFTCTIRDAATDAVFELEVTVDDFRRDEGFLTRDYLITRQVG